MTTGAKNTRKEYFKRYREENRERLNEYNREWRKKNPDKAGRAAVRYWEKKAVEALQQNRGGTNEKA